MFLGTLNITVPDWVNTWLVDPIISVPMLWFAINMLWLLLVSYLLLKFMHYLGELANGALTLRVKINKKMDVKKFETYLESKVIEVTDAVSEPHGDLKGCVERGRQSFVEWRATQIGSSI